MQQVCASLCQKFCGKIQGEVTLQAVTATAAALGFCLYGNPLPYPTLPYPTHYPTHYPTLPYSYPTLPYPTHHPTGITYLS